MKETSVYNHWAEEKQKPISSFFLLDNTNHILMFPYFGLLSKTKTFSLAS